MDQMGTHLLSQLSNATIKIDQKIRKTFWIFTCIINYGNVYKTLAL